MWNYRKVHGSLFYLFSKIDLNLVRMLQIKLFIIQASFMKNKTYSIDYTTLIRNIFWNVKRIRSCAIYSYLKNTQIFIQTSW